MRRGKPLSPFYPFFVALCIFLAGLGLALLSTVRLVQAQRETPVPALYPGETELEVARPGRYTVWQHKVGTFEGSIYHPADEFSGSITVTGPGDEGVAVRPAAGSTTVIDGDLARSLYSFRATAAGTYRLTVAGDMDPRVLSVGLDRGDAVAIRVAMTGAVLLGGFLLALLAGGILWRVRRRQLSIPPPLPVRREPPPVPASAGDRPAAAPPASTA